MTAPPGLRRPDTPNSKEVPLVKVKLLIMLTTLVALLAAPASALAGHFDGH
jgi:hypothetical protein